MNLSKSGKLIVSALAIIALATGGAAFFMMSNSPSPQEAQGILRPDNSPGPKVLITEFADFNCRFCAEFALAYYPRLKEDYLTNPNVEFHFRHYPFLDDTSWDAAHAYECARDQGVHDGFHDLAFQQHLNPDGPNFSPQGLSRMAAVAGADTRTFDNCMWQELHMDKVKLDHSVARQLGIPGTPTLFLGGTPLKYSSYADITNAIEKALAAGDHRLE